MKKKWQFVLINITAFMALSAQINANEPTPYRGYISPMLSYIAPDDARRSENGYGGLLGYGYQISPRWDIEGSLGYDQIAFNDAPIDYQQMALMVDGLFFFNRESTIEIFGVVGGGFMQTKLRPESSTNPALEAGLGLMGKITRGGIKIRSDIRYRFDMDQSSLANEDSFSDLILNVGLTIPLGRSQKYLSPARKKEEAKPIIAAAPIITVTDKEDISFIEEQDIRFTIDSAELTGSLKNALNAVADVLKRNTNLHLELAGFADETGTEEHNLRLSQARSESVKQYLISTGVKANQLTAKGYGEEQLNSEKKDQSLLSKSRRVDLQILFGNDSQASQ